MNKIDKILESWEKYKKNSLEALDIWLKMEDKLTIKQRIKMVMFILRGTFKVNYLKKNLEKWEAKEDEFNKCRTALARSIIAWSEVDSGIGDLTEKEIDELQEKMKVEEFEEKVQKMLVDKGKKPVSLMGITRTLEEVKRLKERKYKE